MTSYMKINTASEKIINYRVTSPSNQKLTKHFPANIYIIAQKMKFSIKEFFSKCDQIRSLLRIWSHLPKKSLMEYFIFCAVLF